MLRNITVGLLAIALVITGLGVAMAFDYVSPSKCKICHKGEKNGNIYEIWQETKHAHAFETLVEKGEQENPECLACHVTGYGQPTGYGAEEVDNTKLAFVSCESCHGPGSGYRTMSIMRDREKAIENGLIIPDETSCVTCHNEKSPTYTEFNFEEFWKKIEHNIPEESEESGE